MKDIDEIKIACRSLNERHALLMEKRARLEWRSAEIEADKTMPPLERMKALLDLLKEYVQMTSCVCKETKRVKELKAQLDDAVARIDDEDGDAG